MIILHAAPLLWGKISGIATSLLGLVSAQHRLDGVCAGLLNTYSRSGAAPRVDFPVFARRGVLNSSERLNLPAPFDRPDLVVFNSTYIPYHALLARRLGELGIPYIICPHGGMTRGAQRFRWWKKRLGNLLFFNQIVAHAKAVHCLTPGEAEASAGWGRPMFIVGNGVSLPAESELAAPGSTQQRQITFIGRLHIETKGLDMLLQACRQVHAELLQAGAWVRLYGPDEMRSARILNTRIAQFSLQDVVTLGGPVMGEMKTAVLKSSDVFLHVSRHEGQPMGVLEALAQGVPCLLTPGTNMADTVAAADAGWRVEPSPAGIAEGLRQVLRAPSGLLQQAGTQARKLAHREFRWERIAAQLVEVYRHYAGGVCEVRERVAA